ncbi:S8 family serine peptidase [Aquamicrobium sp. LC103]|uniref:S8 family serine peptidase n=1 Tax=Aquamicrobium sp. LC103 TaxID=1120658 RepID=UPI00063E8EB0|nr:S8 family serine peptidase [Aquamicrobium sp. LC103]TKT74811.1 peptidase S8 [Aquamicrobium sp. LC103]
MRNSLAAIRTPALLRLLFVFVLSGSMLIGGDWTTPELMGVQPALADDDDDDDDDDDGVGNVIRMFRGQFAPRLPRPQRRSPQRRAQVPAPPPPTRAPDEIVGLGFTAAQLDQMTASGFEVLERSPIASADTEVIKLRIPSGITLEAAREQAVATAPQAVLDFNHYYRPEQGAEQPCLTDDCLARVLVGWPAGQEAPGACTGTVHVGLVDTAINAEHSAFEGAEVEVIRLVDEKLPESGKQHGTAVAALLVGAPESRTPGLVPGARLIALDTFHKARRNDERAEAYNLVRALDLLVERQVHVINMSLSGPDNELLEQAVGRVAERGIIMVAAAGNEGPRSEPVYPAAYEEVVAVTAIDRRKRPYRRAGRGEHIDFAAPGVAVWTAASISGKRTKTGTSFAAPFVTAAAALMKTANPDLTTEQIRERLTRSVEDLGDPGKDPVFGWGLLNARAICGATP